MNEKTLSDYVRNHAIRGACMCGQCADRIENPEQHQPEGNPPGHTADMVFFKVAMAAFPNKGDFIALVKQDYPHWLDGQEHSYLQTGGDMGDQGIALMTMGLGHLLGVWELITPRTMLGNIIDEKMVKEMAGMGYITIKARKPNETTG